MMLKVALYAYLSNIYSCRKIENALQDRDGLYHLRRFLQYRENTRQSPKRIKREEKVCPKRLFFPVCGRPRCRFPEKLTAETAGAA
jgi:hypothetical protein